jgi:NACalpha-BTF3-like transcription factor
MEKKKTFIKVPKPIKNKNMLDIIRKKDTMNLIKKMKEENERKNAYREFLIREMCYILKFYSFDTYEAAIKFVCFETWLYSNILTLISAAKCKNNILTIVLFNRKLKGLIEKIDYDLQRETYIDKEIDIIIKMKEKLNNIVNLHEKVIKNDPTLYDTENNIIIIISQTGATREKAIKSLENNDNDVISAIMEIEMNDVKK